MKNKISIPRPLRSSYAHSAAAAAVFIMMLTIGCYADGDALIQGGSVSFLPEDARVLFVSNRDTGSRRNELYAMNADGGNVMRLTFSKAHHFICGIDNSRRYIVASRAVNDTQLPLGVGDEDKRSLWLLDLKAQEVKRLTALEDNAEGDSFSPDGEWIVFMMTRKGEKTADIYKIKRDGTSLVNLTRTPYASEGDPVWSHDGKRIVFAFIDGTTKRFIIKKMDVEGKGIETVYDGGEGISTPAFPPGNYDPSLSPDDQWVVFERAVSYAKENWGSGIWHIFKARIDGSEVVDLSSAGGHADWAEYLPSYSPDGNSIIFGCMHESKDKKDNFNGIVVMGLDGKVEHSFSIDKAHTMFPSWIPE